MNIDLCVNKSDPNKVIVYKTPDIYLLADSRYDVSHDTIYLCNWAFLFFIVKTFKLKARQRFLGVRNNLKSLIKVQFNNN